MMGLYAVLRPLLPHSELADDLDHRLSVWTSRSLEEADVMTHKSKHSTSIRSSLHRFILRIEFAGLLRR